LRKLIIFGNSSSGKSTLANAFKQKENLAHLDLDTIAWQTTAIPTRKALDESKRDIQTFINTHSQWVIEGCYSDLLAISMLEANEIIYLNYPIKTCINNARNRPWEPHKYPSKAAQDANLERLVEWIGQYDARDDTFSRCAHTKLFNGYTGKKSEYDNPNSSVISER